MRKLTTYLVPTYDVIGIDDPTVAGILPNDRRAGMRATSGCTTSVRQLEYKAELYRTRIVAADRRLASSETCSRCGDKTDTPAARRSVVDVHRVWRS